MPQQGQDAIIEFIPVGSVMRVTAMDPETLTEVTIVGPLTHSQELLRRTVLAKLAYVMNRQSGKAAPSPHPAGQPKPSAMLDVQVYGPNGALRKIR